jgi:hypothetical protein
MNFSLPSWINKHRGKAKGGFRQAVLSTSKTSTPARAKPVPKIVAQSAPGLQDGPKPPAALYNAGKRAAFNHNWRAEYRAELAAQSARRAASEFRRASFQSRSR